MKRLMTPQMGSQGLVKPFLAIFLFLSVLVGAILAIVYYQEFGKIVSATSPELLQNSSEKILEAFVQLYAALLVPIGIGSWWLVLTRISHQLAQKELEQAAAELQELASHKDLLKRRLSSQVRDSLDLEIILNTAVSEIRNLLQIDRCKFLWYQPNAQEMRFELNCEACDRTLSSTTSSQADTAIALLGEAILQFDLAIAETTLPSGLIRVNNISTDNGFNRNNRELLLGLGINSLLAVSIHTNSGRIGVIVCEHGKRIHQWSDEEVELLQAIADQLAIAINQAELYNQSRANAAIAIAQAEQLSAALENLQKTQAQLIQTEKMSSLGQLVAGVAHEINNPVNFIYGNLSHANDYSQDLLELVLLYQKYYPNPAPEIQDRAAAIDLEFLMEDMPKMLDSMKIGADRIRQIVLTLRNFSRIDEAEMKPVDIHEGIDSTLLILQNRLKAKSDPTGIKVVKEYGALPKVECYAGQLNQVFMNIISNAIDALTHYNIQRCEEETRQYPSIIKICTETLHPSHIRVRISDNGAGMTEAVKARLFDPFFTTKPADLGTGLGLSISYQIVVEKHGGSLKCISTPGQGTEFSIEIPIQQNNLNSPERSELSAIGMSS